MLQEPYILKSQKDGAQALASRMELHGAHIAAERLTKEFGSKIDKHKGWCHTSPCV